MAKGGYIRKSILSWDLKSLISHDMFRSILIQWLDIIFGILKSNHLQVIKHLQVKCSWGLIADDEWWAVLVAKKGSLAWFYFVFWYFSSFLTTYFEHWMLPSHVISLIQIFLDIMKLLLITASYRYDALKAFIHESHACII